LNVLVNVPAGGYPDPMFFTATAMIGMIALAGIVVRNSAVLIEFIQMAVREGTPLREAVIQSVAVRTRPILATAGTTLLGNWVITLDPIFSGLAWAIMFGILTSTVFTLRGDPHRLLAAVPRIQRSPISSRSSIWCGSGTNLR
jgi:multidrug efflux pump subunit AcrB